MDSNNQFDLYFSLNLTSLSPKFYCKRLLIPTGNEYNPGVEELQRYLANATVNIAVPRENLTITDSAPIPNSAMAFSANSRSPPISDRLLFPA